MTISELVKEEPATINELIEYIRQRIFVESNPYLTENDQEEMVIFFYQNFLNQFHFIFYKYFIYRLEFVFKKQNLNGKK